MVLAEGGREVVCTVSDERVAACQTAPLVAAAAAAAAAAAGGGGGLQGEYDDFATRVDNFHCWRHRLHHRRELAHPSSLPHCIPLHFLLGLSSAALGMDS